MIQRDPTRRTEEELALARPARAPRAIKVVLVAVAATRAGANAVEVGAGIAARHGAKLVLVHALEALAHGPPAHLLVPARVQQLFARAETLLAGGGSPHPGKCLECLAAGLPASEIVSVAAQYDTDLIVTGTRHRPGARRLESGSVAGAVIESGHVPVLVVHERWSAPADGLDGFRRPAVAVDYGDASRAALATTAVLGRAEIDVVRAVERDHLRIPEDATALEKLDARAQALRAERERLEGWIRATLGEPPAGTTRAAITVGRPRRALIDFTVGGGYDLVACGTHGKRTGVLVGSVAEALLDALECPVLVLREARVAP